jgi:hypothetical protein
MILEVLMGFSAISFLIFGMSCFTTHYMKCEFERYQLGSFRQLTGLLQICGGLALIIGFNWKWAIYAGSGGLALLMFFGFLVRIRIRDGVWKSSPALIYMIINLMILFLVDNPV